MTIEDELRQLARRADQEQRPITVDEIMARSGSDDATPFVEPARPTTSWRHRRQWLLVAAAVVVVVAAAIGLVVDTDDDAGSIRTVTDPPTTAPARIRNGAVVFAADAGAGVALTDPVDVQRVETVPEPMDIYLARPGEPVRRLVSTDAHERCPSFSPDGERLAYLSVPGTRPGGSWPTTGPALDATLVVLPFDGATVRARPELEVRFPAAWGYGVKRVPGHACPRWSPDGSRIAFLAQPLESSGNDHTDDLAELRVVTLDGEQRVLNAGTPADEGASFAWSPAGDAIAYLRDDGVWRATLRGDAPVRIWQPNGTARALAWSSRGELAVTVEPPEPSRGHEVHVVDTDAGTATLVDGTTALGPASWSPDGARLALIQEWGIVLHTRDDASTVRVPEPVLDGRQGGFGLVTWSPDGGRLLALAHAVGFGDAATYEENLRAYVASRGLALVSLSTDGALLDVLTPWTWALDWIAGSDVSWQGTTSGR